MLERKVKIQTWNQIPICETMSLMEDGKGDRKLTMLTGYPTTHHNLGPP